jgi:hypothetical protein
MEFLDDSAVDDAFDVSLDLGLGRLGAGFLNGGLSQHPLPFS